MNATPTKKVCSKCERPVGMISPHMARPYTTEIDSKGVSIVCSDTRSCKLTRMTKS